MTETRKPVCVAEITAAHGVRGQVKVRSFTQKAEDFASFGALSDAAGKKAFTVKIVGRLKDFFLVSIDGITDRTAADSLRGTKLFVDRSVLPETDADEFYITDLVGLTAKTEDGKILGRVAGVYNFGAGDMIEIENMAEFLPFSKTVVPDVDLENGVVTVVPPVYVEASNPAGKEGV